MTSPPGADQLESWGKLFAKVGGYGLIAGWLIYQLGTDIKSNAEQTLELMRAHTLTTAPLLGAINSLVNVELQRCANDAETRTERDLCFSAVYQTPQK